MKSLFLLPAFIMSCLVALGQSGSSPADAFTALGQAYHVHASGEYWFNIGGEFFSTFVEMGDGWLLVASGNSETSESTYSRMNGLQLQSDGILPALIYSSPLITEVRMNASGGPGLPFDVQSSNATVLDNLRNDRTLSVGTNSSDWTGVGTANLFRGCPSIDQSLATLIYHACGYPPGMFWAVGLNSEFEKINSQLVNKNDLNLWIRAASVPLPVELSGFRAQLMDNGYVKINWTTISETNNDHFVLEKSRDGLNWETLEKIDGKGNSQLPSNYEVIDKYPFPANSYYRLKQTDFDGQFSYSKIEVVNKLYEGKEAISIYPNPAVDFIWVEGPVDEYHLYNLLGQNITHHTKTIKADRSGLLIELTDLIAGVYILKLGFSSYKIQKQ